MLVAPCDARSRAASELRDRGPSRGAALRRFTRRRPADAAACPPRCRRSARCRVNLVHSVGFGGEHAVAAANQPAVSATRMGVRVHGVTGTCRRTAAMTAKHRRPENRRNATKRHGSLSMISSASARRGETATERTGAAAGGHQSRPQRIEGASASLTSSRRWRVEQRKSSRACENETAQPLGDSLTRADVAADPPPPKRRRSSARTSTPSPSTDAAGRGSPRAARAEDAVAHCALAPSGMARSTTCCGTSSNRGAGWAPRRASDRAIRMRRRPARRRPPPPVRQRSSRPAARSRTR